MNLSREELDVMWTRAMHECVRRDQNIGRSRYRFAALVAAAEREACAKLIESRKTGADKLMDAVRDMEAKAIRARGQA
jgi:hypothetical protein